MERSNQVAIEMLLWHNERTPSSLPPALLLIFPTKKRSYQPSFSCDKNNDATNRLWVVFCVWQVEKLRKENKAIKEKVRTGLQARLFTMKKIPWKDDNCFCFLGKSTPAMNKTRWGEDHQFNMYIFTYRYEASEKVQVYQEAWSESFLLVTFCWEQSPFMYFLHTT